RPAESDQRYAPPHPDRLPLAGRACPLRALVAGLRVVPLLATGRHLVSDRSSASGWCCKLRAESSDDPVSHSLMAAACRRCQAASKARLTITASGFGCP